MKLSLQLFPNVDSFVDFAYFASNPSILQTTLASLSSHSLSLKVKFDIGTSLSCVLNWPYWSPFVEYFPWLIVRASSQKQIDLIFWNYWWHHVLYIMYIQTYIFYIPYQSKLLQRPLQPYSHGKIYWNNTPVSFLIPRNEHHPWCKKFPCHQRYFFLWPWPMRYPVPNSYTPPLHHCHPNSHHWNRMVITSNVWCQWSSFDFTILVFHYKVLLLVVCWLRQLIVILCSNLDLVLNILLAADSSSSSSNVVCLFVVCCDQVENCLLIAC